MQLSTPRLLRTLITAGLALLLTTPIVAAQGGGNEMQTVRAVAQMLRGSGDDSLRVFAEEWLAPSYRDSMSGDALLVHLRGLREGVRGALGNLDVEGGPGGLTLRFAAEREAAVRVALAPQAPGKITGLELEEAGEGGGADRRATVRGRMRALESLASAVDDAALRRFAEEHLTPAFRGGLPERQLFELLDGIRKVTATAGSIMVTEDAEGTRARFRGAFNGDVVFQLEDAAPYRIRSLALDTDIAPEGADREPPEHLEWAGVAARLQAAVKDGFAGTVLLVRDGKVVLHQGYGLASREAGRAAATDTIYGIGSMPIDFTRAAVLLLAQQGKLRLSDPISRFVPDVPEDKRSMTLEHLMWSRSGLPNFHHRPGTDADYDLTWIDRETALRRILEQPLLFPPGEGEAHSHSAYGLLAAIVEIVSEKTYGDFLRTNFFAPAGMERTGSYGEDLGYGVEELAVGYGQSRVGDPNIPPNWGPTSWLVMGSGGMFSTPGDMHRFFTTLQQGKILEGEPLRRYLKRGVGVGASDRGFYFVRAWDGDGTMVFFASNVLGQERLVEGLGDALIQLVMAE